MIQEQATTNPDRERAILVLLLVVFITLGSWLAILVPFFQGPDEQIHYATLQYWAEPDEKTWPIAKSQESNQSDDIRTYHLSEEIRETAHRMQFDEIKWQPTNTQSFVSNVRFGKHEEMMASNSWDRYIDTYPINASGTWSLYYWLGEKIETFFSEQSLFDRMFLARLLSVSIGALIVIIAFASTRKLGWSPTLATLFAALIAFQPMFIATSAVVNIDILLVFAFSLFFYGGVRWLSDGASVSSGLILTSATLIGILTKGPGIVLLGLVAALGTMSLYRSLGWNWRDFLPRFMFGVFVVLALLFMFTPAHILANFLHLGAASVFTNPLESLSAYVEKTLSAGAITWTAMTYWGSFGWLDTNIPESVLRIILAIEAIAVFGLIWFFFDKTPPRFLPEKRVLFFAILSILLLQFSIRFFDWRVFDATGKILIGTPGRYFLPNIIPHMLFVITGLGYFVETARAFQRLLMVFSTLLFLLFLYASWFIIIPRYYL